MTDLLTHLMYKFRDLEQMFKDVAELGFSETHLSGTLSRGEMTSYQFNRPAEEGIPELYLSVNAWPTECFMSIDTADFNKKNHYAPLRMLPVLEVKQEIEGYLERFRQK